jgi:hypothetical protein
MADSNVLNGSIWSTASQPLYTGTGDATLDGIFVASGTGSYGSTYTGTGSATLDGLFVAEGFGTASIQAVYTGTGDATLDGLFFSSGQGTATQQVPTFTDVQLLLHGGRPDGSTVFVDSSSYNRSPTAFEGDPAYSDGWSKFSSTSLLIVNDNFSYSNLPGGSVFTAEGFANETDRGDNRFLSNQYTTSTNNTEWALDASGDDIILIVNNASVGTAVGTRPPQGTPYYLAVVYNGSSFLVYIQLDGETDASLVIQTVNGVFAPADGFIVGGAIPGSPVSSQYMEEVRYTHAALYTGAAYPVPVAAFPDEGSNNPVTFYGTIPLQQPAVGQPYSLDTTPYFQGFFTAFTYADFNNVFPWNGLTFTNGVISGTPLAPDNLPSVIVEATDQNSNTAQSNDFVIDTASAPVGSGGIFVGDLVVNEIFVGQTSVSKVYAGTIKVWPAFALNTDGLSHRVKIEAGVTIPDTGSQGGIWNTDTGVLNASQSPYPEERVGLAKTMTTSNDSLYRSSPIWMGSTQPCTIMYWARTTLTTGQIATGSVINNSKFYSGHALDIVNASTFQYTSAAGSGLGTNNSSFRRSRQYNFGGIVPNSNDGEWHHIAYSFNGVYCNYMYVDGIELGWWAESGQATTLGWDAGDVTWRCNVAAWQDPTGVAWGDICDHRLYNRQLEDYEVLDIANGGS